MKRSLLIVDSTPENRVMLKQLLSDKYNISEAGSAIDAIDFLSSDETRYSAVLIELSLPEKDGYSLIEYIKNSPKLRLLPVIATVSGDDGLSESMALKTGAADCIAYPYDPDIVIQRIHNAIKLRESNAAVYRLQHDSLTGLYNRTAFFEKASEMIRCKDPGFYIISCFDVDNFKMINDQYGVETGDKILRFLAQTFKSGFKAAGGICCRMMCDIFAVLFPRSFADSAEICEIRRKAAGYDGSIKPVTFSIGRYIIDDLSLSVSAMYDRASMAANSIKGRYDVEIAYFDVSMRDKLVLRQRIKNEMKPALEQGQFEPWFQPQYNYATGNLIGAEALARWRHPQDGIISPAVFIPVFEETGFIYEFDKYIWEQICICLKRWIGEGRNPLPISVNISRYDIFRDGFIDTLESLIHRYDIPVDLLRLEITESTFSVNTARIIEIVNQLISLGFIVEIDDFGSGYSSLNTLKDVPAQIIKLDMRFLQSAGESQRGGNIIESVIRMAKWLDMTVIAEGVETIQQADFLKSIGCTFIQGYLYAKPMPVSEYEALARKSQKQFETPAIEAIEHLDNNSFWDPDSIDTLIFNNYLGGAGIYEFYEGRLELLRANEKFIKVLSGAGMTMETALKLNWTDHMESEGRKRLLKALDCVSVTGEESSGELLYIGLPGCADKVYLRSNMRVIAKN